MRYPARGECSWVIPRYWARDKRRPPAVSKARRSERAFMHATQMRAAAWDELAPRRSRQLFIGPRRDESQARRARGVRRRRRPVGFVPPPSADRPERVRWVLQPGEMHDTTYVAKPSARSKEGKHARLRCGDFAGDGEAYPEFQRSIRTYDVKALITEAV